MLVAAAEGVGGAGPKGEGDDHVKAEELWGVSCGSGGVWKGGTYHSTLEVVGLAVLDGVGGYQHGEGKGDGFDWAGS